MKNGWIFEGEGNELKVRKIQSCFFLLVFSHKSLIFFKNMIFFFFKKRYHKKENAMNNF